MYSKRLLGSEIYKDNHKKDYEIKANTQTSRTPFSDFNDILIRVLKCSAILKY